MEKLNCWEYTNCGRNPGGKNVSTLGVCPASILTSANGYLGGENGGRACVYITGTFCAGTIQGTFKDKEKHCTECDFYKSLRKDETTHISVLSFVRFVNDKKMNPEISSEKAFLPVLVDSEL